MMTAHPGHASAPRRATHARHPEVRGSTRGINVTWAGLTSDTEGREVGLQDVDTLEIEVSGIFAGAHLALVSHAGSTVCTLRSPGRVTLYAPPGRVRPVIVGGDRDTAITVRIVASPRR